MSCWGLCGQGVDGARLEARRDDEVAGSFGRALDEDRRLDLDEAVLLVDAPDLRHQLRAQQKAAQHRLPPDVQVAVLEADRLVHRRVRLVDVEGRRLCLGEDRERAGLELDLAGCQAGVLHARQAARDVALDRDHELRPAAGRDGVGLGRVGGVHHDLREAVAVAHVEEDELAVVAAAVNPAREAGRATLVGGAQGAAGVRPVRGGEAGGGLGHGPRMVAARPPRARRGPAAATRAAPAGPGSSTGPAHQRRAGTCQPISSQPR